MSWIVKDDFIGNTFFDASSTAFILPTFESEGRTVRVIRPAGDATAVSHPPVCEVTGECSIGEISGRDRVAGGGLGPEWLSRARERAVPLDGLGLAGGGQGTPRHTLSVYFSDCVARLDCAGGAAMPLRVHTVQGQVRAWCHSCSMSVSTDTKCASLLRISPVTSWCRPRV